MPVHRQWRYRCGMRTEKQTRGGTLPPLPPLARDARNGPADWRDHVLVIAGFLAVCLLAIGYLALQNHSQRSWEWAPIVPGETQAEVDRKVCEANYDLCKQR